MFGLRALSNAQASALSARKAAARQPLRLQADVEAPAPWALIAPLALGSGIGNGWRIHSLSDVRLGAAVLRVGHTSGAEGDVHICLRDGQPTGVASSRKFDFVLMNSANGGVQTDEALGVSLLGLARAAQQNEDSVSPTGFMAHRSRLEQFGWERIA